MWNKQLYRIQFRRLFSGWMFWASCAVSTVLVVMQTYTSYNPIYRDSWAFPASVFSRWIGNDIGTFAASLFYDLLPLICMLPFGIQYLIDKQNGYLKNLMIRVPAKAVITSYGVCTFIGAFVACMLPFLLSLLINSLLYPALLPESTALTLAAPSAMLFGTLYYTHPFLYCFLYSAITAIYEALLVLAGMAFGFLIKNIFFSLVLPFLFNFLASYIALSLHITVLAPIYIFQPTQQVLGEPSIILAWYAVCLLPTLVLFGRHMRNYELY